MLVAICLFQVFNGRQTWLRAVENDLKQQNMGLWSARHRAYDREQWRDVVETATLLWGHAT